MVTYIKGARLLPQLVVDNYKYLKHRSAQKVTYWKCHLYDSGACKARCIIGIDQSIILSGDHDHTPTYEHIPDDLILFKEIFLLKRICRQKSTFGKISESNQN
ncbi:hypothetical protein WA026_007531 [Henosepilachna vigintioctopunctata]|uniref:FLYWCH-type domain-containing protein n=1 Tax=Henosepilachna vigintioctopunctata TaxID=420089 RepID=A0AAW1UXX2_9CUCU